MELDPVDMLRGIERHFAIDILEPEAENLVTVGKLCEFVVAKLHQHGHPETNPDLVFQQLRNIICRNLSIETDRVFPTTRFDEDLIAS